MITLDVEMPRMDGITFLEKLMRAHPLPVVMVLSLTQRGCETTLRALELGALDFVTKPKIDVARGTAEVASEIVAKIKVAGVAGVRKKVALPPAGAAAPVNWLPARPLSRERTELSASVLLPAARKLCANCCARCLRIRRQS